MKKIFAIALMIGLTLSFGANAQRATTFPIIAGDTVITSSSLDTVNKVITVTAGYSALGIQVIATKVSGTVTAKAYLWGSLDGTTYNLTDSATAFANAAGVQAVWFTKLTTPYVFYKVQVRNVGTIASTESVAVSVKYVLRRHD